MPRGVLRGFGTIAGGVALWLAALAFGAPTAAAQVREASRAVIPPAPFMRSILPAGVEASRAVARPSVRREGAGTLPAVQAVPSVVEHEPPDQWGLNDTPVAAEFLEAFGTGLGDQSLLDVSGTLGAPPVEEREAYAEDDGSLFLANDTGLRSGHRIRYRAFIGDGPHGSEGSARGDFDVYKVGGVRAGQVLLADVDTSEPFGPLNTKVGLYTSEGVLVTFNDDGDRTSYDSYLTFVAPADGDYYVLVRGSQSDWPSDPFDSGSGPKAGNEGSYWLTLGLDAEDTDAFAFLLAAGDVIGTRMNGAAMATTLVDPSGVVLIRSSQDAGLLFPAVSPLPRGGRASAAYVVPAAGRYIVAVSGGTGAYTLNLRVFRPPMGAGGQTLFLDFDGAELDAARLFNGHPQATLSPLSAFLNRFGLDATPGGGDEQAVVDAILARVEAVLVEDVRARGLNPALYLDLRNSRDHPDPFGEALVSRIVVGGTIDELGTATIATAESVDVGNFAGEESAVVLLDLLSGPPEDPNSLNGIPRAPGVSMVDLIGVAVGNIVAHEAGHLFANFHTGTVDSPPNLMDVGGDLPDVLGLGPDGTFGTTDDLDVTFGPAPYSAREGFEGTQDTRNAVAFGLSGPSDPLAVEADGGGRTASVVLGTAHPNPFSTETRVTLVSDRAARVRVDVFDARARRVAVLYDGWISASVPHVVSWRAGACPSGVYWIRAAGPSGAATRPVVLAR